MWGALVLLAGAVLLLRQAPDLPLSRLLEDWLARPPAAWILRRTRRELIAWTIVFGMLTFGGEYILVIGGPHAVVVFAADLAAYVDAVIAVATIASVARVRAGARWFAVRRALRPAPRTRRAPRRPVAKPNANDDEAHRARLAA